MNQLVPWRGYPTTVSTYRPSFSTTPGAVALDIAYPAFKYLLRKASGPAKRWLKERARAFLTHHDNHFPPWKTSGKTGPKNTPRITMPRSKSRKNTRRNRKFTPKTPLWGNFAVPRKGGGKRVFKKGRQGRRTTVSLSSRVRRLETKTANPPGIYRNLDSGSIECAKNLVKYTSFTLGRLTDQDALVGVVGINILTAGTTDGQEAVKIDPQDTVNLGSVPCYITNWYRTHRLKNNNNAPVLLHAQWFVSSKGSEDSLETLFTNGMADSGHSGTPTALTDLRYNIKDCPLVRRYWKRYRSEHYELQPGQAIKLSTGIKKTTYHPQEVDTVAAIHVRGVTRVLLLRIQGEVAHDTTDDALVGTAACSLDWVFYEGAQVRTKTSLVLRKLVSHSGVFDTLADDELILPDAPGTMEDVDITE